MELGIIGLGRMGLGLALRAAQRGHDVVAWDLSDHARRRAHDQGLRAPATVEDLVEALRPPRAIFLYVPHGDPVSYTHLRAHETDSYLVCRLLLEKKKKR